MFVLGDTVGECASVVGRAFQQNHCRSMVCFQGVEFHLEMERFRGRGGSPCGGLPSRYSNHTRLSGRGLMRLMLGAALDAVMVGRMSLHVQSQFEHDFVQFQLQCHSRKKVPSSRC